MEAFAPKRTEDIVPQEDLDLCKSLTEPEERLVRDVISRVSDKWSL